MASRILVVEDDPNLLETLRYNFVKEGYEAITAADGIKALETAREQKPDLILLDVMLPGMSGFEVCRILRKEMAVPILILTAKDDEIDKIAGLDLGADDYMTKPFSLRELMARIRAMLRRTGTLNPIQGKQFRVADIELDVDRHVVTKAGNELSLTPKEFDLLAFLVQNVGRVVSREQLLQSVWGYDYAGDTRTVDVHVRWLREKTEDDPEQPKRIVTVRGVGYKLQGQ